MCSLWSCVNPGNRIAEAWVSLHSVGPLTHSQNGNPPHFHDFLGTLEKIHTNDKGEVLVNVRWFYRPEVRELVCVIIIVSTAILIIATTSLSSAAYSHQEVQGGRQSWHGRAEVCTVNTAMIVMMMVNSWCTYRRDIRIITRCLVDLHVICVVCICTAALHADFTPQVLDSDHRDTVPVSTINCKAKIYTLEEYLALPRETRDAPDFPVRCG